MVFISAPLLLRLGPRCAKGDGRPLRSAEATGTRDPAGADRPVERQVSVNLSHKLIAGRFSQVKLNDEVFVSEVVVGSGTSGKVLSGRYLDSQDVAVKTLSRSRSIKQQNLESEVELLLSVDHPNVVRLQRVYETRSRCHLVMEHLKGGELLARLTKMGRFGEAVAGKLFAQMMSAVAYLHRMGIVHCDLKVDNCVFESHSSVHLKLIDFGVAQRFTPTAKLTKFCGSPHYTAPEIFRGCYDEKVDLWSLGVVLYMLLTGVMPIRVRSGGDARNLPGDLYFYPPLWNPLSPIVRNLIESLLELDPARRPSAQECLTHAWLSLRRPLIKPGNGGVRGCLERFIEEASEARQTQLALAAWSLPAERHEELRQKFNFIDCDFDGVLSAIDFKTSFKLSDTEASRFATRLDVNGDEVVTFSDFVAAILHSRSCELLNQPSWTSDLDKADAMLRNQADDSITPLPASAAKALSICSTVEGSESNSECDDFNRRVSEWSSLENSAL